MYSKSLDIPDARTKRSKEERYYLPLFPPPALLYGKVKDAAAPSAQSAERTAHVDDRPSAVAHQNATTGKFLA